MRARLAIVALYAGFAAAFFSPSLLTDRVLLPTDNLVGYSPWREHAAELGLTRPNNSLSSDAVLQNISWRRFVHASWARGDPPLWNPSILGGQPFLATGQNQPLYPLAAMLMFLPATQWYEWFLAVHLLLGMLFTHLFLRELTATRAGSILGATAFGLCGFLAVSTMWPQMISTAIWLPLLFWGVERTIRVGQGPGAEVAGSPEFPAAAPRPFGEPHPAGTGPARLRPLLPPLLTLAAAVALQFLAGHPEINFYNLAGLGLYAFLRLLQVGRRSGRPLGSIGLGSALGACVLIGVVTAGAQLIPFVEVSANNFRTGQTTYDDVRGYALPAESLLAFLAPNVFGNPTHHQIFDLTRLEWRPAGRLDGLTGNLPDPQAGTALGDGGEVPGAPSAAGPARSTEWGKKNFVESTVYIGVAPLLLGALGVWLSRIPQRWPLAILAAVSLLLAFGTPLLAPLFFLVPGYGQLHTPFRWVFPFGFAVAVLAGLGLSALQGAAQPAASRVGRITLLSSGVLALALVTALLARDTVVEFAADLLRSGRLAAAFPDAATLFSYQWANAALFVTLLGVAGLGILLIRSTSSALTSTLSRRERWLAVGPFILIAVTAIDLTLFGAGYSTAGDAAVLDYVPPEIRAIQQDAARDPSTSPFRVMAFGSDVLPANTAALFGLEDIRGYDSMIKREYVEYLSALEPDNVRAMLLFSKIEALNNPRSLTSPLLDALGVRYVLTREPLPEPGLILLHDGSTRVYRRESALPRVMVLSHALDADSAQDAIRLLASGRIDPRTSVAVEGPSRNGLPTGMTGSRAPLGKAAVAHYGPNEVRVRVEGGGGFLVLFDAYAPGWTAFVDGQQQPVRRANGVFREVSVSPGAREVVFAYQPTSWRIGLLLSAAGLLTLLGLAAIWAWQGLLVRTAQRSTLVRVLKNAFVPIVAGSLNKVMDLGLAIVMLRILGPTEVGRYTWAVLVVGYFDILVNFGLGVLLTRDLARDPASVNRYLGTAVAARIGLSVIALVAAALIAGPLAGPLALTPAMSVALVLLTTGIAISNVSGLATAVFNAREQMEYPAYIGTLTTILKVVAGVAVLTLGYGIVGLAAVSIAVNLLTGLAMVLLLVTVLGRPSPSFDPSLAGGLFGASYPLMLNNLLATLFFRIDGLILRSMWGDTVLGWYGAAYKFIDGLNVIPSQFTLALFPVFSRASSAGTANLTAGVELALKALLAIAMPLAVGTSLLAEPLVRLIAGDEYVPHSVVALQVLIWFLPFSFINGLLQYVLIAADQQRFITKSFVLAAGFNLGANLLLIPHWSYVGAAAITIASELVLLGPFWYAVQRHVGPVRLLAIAWRPALAAVAMGVVARAVEDWPLATLILLSSLVYGSALLVLGAVGHEEREMLRRAWQSVRGAPEGPEPTSISAQR